jgi:hypothetical protein
MPESGTILLHNKYLRVIQKKSKIPKGNSKEKEENDKKNEEPQASQ